MTTLYPRIEKMMAGYINMDAFEMTGSPDRVGQVRYYTTRVSPKALQFLLLELDAFENEHRSNLTEDFEEEFDFGAGIPDAHEFFAIVRQEVSAALDERKDGSDKPIKRPKNSAPAVKEKFVEIDTSTFFTEIYKQLSEENRTPGKPIIAGNSRYIKDLTDKIWHDFINVKDTSEQKPKASFELHLKPELGRYMSGVKELSDAMEQLLILQARHMSYDKRLTEEYVQLLEQILKLKGVDVNKTSRDSPAYVKVIEAFIQNQERKVTR